MKENQFTIRAYDDDRSEFIALRCNRIESAPNATLVYGIIEESSHDYDILIASIPTSKTVFIESEENSENKLPHPA